MISAAAQYALRLLVHLARRGASEIVRVREIADAEGIPGSFLAKLIGQLVQAGYVDSFKGPGGGIRLACPPHRTSVLDVVAAVDGPDFFTQCFLGLPACGDDTPCPVHNEWKSVKTVLMNRLLKSSIAELAQTAELKSKNRQQPLPPPVSVASAGAGRRSSRRLTKGGRQA